MQFINNLRNTGRTKEDKLMDRTEFPDFYYKDRLVLMVKNPFTLHAYWEITTHLRNMNPGQLILRTYGFTPEIYFFDNKIEQEKENYYIDVNRPDTEFYAQIGIYSNNRFKPILESNRVRTPRNTVSDVIDQNWLSLKEVYLRTLRKRQGPSSPEFIEGLSIDRKLQPASEAVALRKEGNK